MRSVDLFAGCGGMSLGFMNQGFDVVAAYEYWDDAIQCYSDNFAHPILKQDLSAVEEAVESIAQWGADIVIGGPPCQDFSHAGKRSEGNRAVLTNSYAEIVARIKPTWFVMENVDRTRNSVAYCRAREIFQSAGYGLTERVLDSSLSGVPQRRKRFFCIGRLGAEDGFLDDVIDSNLDNCPMTLRDYFGDKLGIDYYYRHPRNYNRRGVFSIDEPAPTVRGVNRPVPKGYPGHPNDATAITDSLRPLSTLERALIQTFPEDFKWSGSKTVLEQMIGNAVPVKLAELVAKSILMYDSRVSNDSAKTREKVLS